MYYSSGLRFTREAGVSNMGRIFIIPPSHYIRSTIIQETNKGTNSERSARYRDNTKLTYKNSITLRNNHAWCHR